MRAQLEEAFRNVVADSMAQGFIVEILLANRLSGYPREERKQVVDAILKSSMQTEHYEGLFEGNDAMAELFADVVVRMQNAVDQLVGRALIRIGDPPAA